MSSGRFEGLAVFEVAEKLANVRSVTQIKPLINALAPQPNACLRLIGPISKWLTEKEKAA